MTILAVPAAAIGSLRQRLTDDMTLRRFSRETQRNYIRDVGRLATFLRRSPDTATVDDRRRFQIAQQEVGLGVPTMNATASMRLTESLNCGAAARLGSDIGTSGEKPSLFIKQRR